MEEIISKVGVCGYYINEITETMDKYVNNSYNDPDFMVYIFPEKVRDNTWYIRYPGNTVGDITLDKDDIIISICINESANLIFDYMDDMIKELEQFICKKLIL
jgi:hypothetical protein